ncbi:hypothetical protein KCP76_15860 [Salmonella enterica subsp. enterica serovar Weltevreden]|nr:hypothetical protein KCP76_15860 [Salmonella enterica subsp. enterica serovar Weltevreden]
MLSTAKTGNACASYRAAAPRNVIARTREDSRAWPDSVRTVSVPAHNVLIFRCADDAVRAGSRLIAYMG